MKQFWQENKGSISLFATLSIIAVLMILFLSINIGNIFAKKSLVEDTAEALAPILLANQIDRTIPPDTGSIPPTSDALTTAQNVIDNSLDSSLSNATVIQPIFGIWNSTPPANQKPFCAFGEPCMSSSNSGISPTDPVLNNVILQPGEDFAVAFQLDYPLSPLGSLLNFSSLLLKGKAIAKTDLTFGGEDPPDPADDCCCDAAAVANGTVTITTRTMFIFEGCWKDNPAIETPNMFGITLPDRFGSDKDEQCFRDNIFKSLLNYSGSATCKSYSDCRGTFWEALWDGKAFSRFLDIFRCWFDNFLKDLKSTITTVSGNINDMWDGWS